MINAHISEDREKDKNPTTEDYIKDILLFDDLQKYYEEATNRIMYRRQHRDKLQ